MTDTVDTSTASDHTVRVWDLPVRITHWSFAALVPLAWWTADNSHWIWHRRIGLALLGLLIFRVLWGFAGTRTARFASFVRGPGSVIDYLRGTLAHTIGHSPLAALSVLALLGAMFAQVGMGLFAGDPYDGLTGPLNPLVGVLTADMLTEWHETFYWVLGGLVVLHLAAIAFYAVVKRTNLVGPMVSGKRAAEQAIEGNESTPVARALVLAAVSAGFTLWIAYGAPPFA